MKTMQGIVFSLVFCIPAFYLHAGEQAATVESRVKTLLVDPATQTPVVVLETVADKRMLPIWIDVPEARAIALELENVALPRPLTHDLIRNILRGVGATLQRITITDLRNDTYYAELSLTVREAVVLIDSRPSDAIAVALRMKAPIFVSTQVLAKSKPIPAPSERREQSPKKLGIQGQDQGPELPKLLDTRQHQGTHLGAPVLISTEPSYSVDSPPRLEPIEFQAKVL